MSLPPEYDNLRSGAMPGRDEAENDIYMAGAGFEMPQSEAAKIAENILSMSQAELAQSIRDAKPDPAGGMRQGYGDPRL